MSAYIDMSLEDIIQKRKQKIRNNDVGMKNKTKNQPLPQKQKIVDARNKIISKKRFQITDAREKLAELAKKKDARMKLEQLRIQKIRRTKPSGRNIPLSSQSHGPWMRNIQNREKVFLDTSRQVRSQPRPYNGWSQNRSQGNNKRFTENRSIGSRESSSVHYIKPILRTVENDVVMLDDDDPMGEEYGSSARSAVNQRSSLNLKIVARSSETRNRSSSYRRNNPPEREKSPPRPLQSILKKRPSAAQRTEKKPERSEIVSTEYRIIVSNLRSSVSGGDIQELFGDVGGMVESRLVRPGTAEVLYKSQEDAQRAVELYHNRQLDGQPMNCLLVTPRSSAPPQLRGSTKPTLPPSTNSNVEPDLSTFHKVLFSNF